MPGGRPLSIAWKHMAEEFYRLYKAEGDVHVAKRWQALWLLRQGERLVRVREIVGVTNKPIQGRVWWYEGGGIEEVARHRWGAPGVYVQAWMAKQEARILERAAGRGFCPIREAALWYEAEFGVKVSEAKMGYWVRKWGIKRKVPRPIAEKADERQQDEWKKGLWKCSGRLG